jgi:Ulp1 family protease
MKAKRQRKAPKTQINKDKPPTNTQEAKEAPQNHKKPTKKVRPQQTPKKHKKLVKYNNNPYQAPKPAPKAPKLKPPTT